MYLCIYICMFIYLALILLAQLPQYNFMVNHKHSEPSSVLQLAQCHWKIQFIVAVCCNVLQC